MSKRRQHPVDSNTPRALLLRGVCVQCRTQVGKERLVNVGNDWICTECGNARIRSWNQSIKEAENKTL